MKIMIDITFWTDAEVIALRKFVDQTRERISLTNLSGYHPPKDIPPIKTSG